MSAPTVTVVRIERTELGPWMGNGEGSVTINMLRRRFGSKAHRRHEGPTVYRSSFDDEFSYAINSERAVYGCQSYEELVAYFGIKIIRHLLKRGYEIKTYTVDWRDVRFGDGELVVKGSAIYPRDESDAAELKQIDVGSFIVPEAVKRYRQIMATESVEKGQVVYGAN